MYQSIPRYTLNSKTKREEQLFPAHGGELGQQMPLLDMVSPLTNCCSLISTTLR